MNHHRDVVSMYHSRCDVPTMGGTTRGILKHYIRVRHIQANQRIPDLREIQSHNPSPDQHYSELKRHTRRKTTAVEVMLKHIYISD